MSYTPPSIIFVTSYFDVVSKLKQVVDVKFYPVIAKMHEENPHDLVTPDQVFMPHQIKGIVLGKFYEIAEQMNLLTN